MKRLIPFFIAAIVAFPVGKVAMVATGVTAVVATQGCAADTRTRWAQARVTLTRVEQTIATLHEQGEITDDQLVNQINPAVVSARAALDSAEAEMVAGNELGFRSFMSAVDRVLDQLLILAAQD